MRKAVAEYTGGHEPASAQTRCPHCQARQPFAGNQRQPCVQCKQPFYPTPLDTAATVAQRRKLGRHRSRAAAAAAGARIGYAIRAAGAVLILGPACWGIAVELEWLPRVVDITRMQGRLIILVGALLFALGQFLMSRADASPLPRDPPHD